MPMPMPMTAVLMTWPDGADDTDILGDVYDPTTLAVIDAAAGLVPRLSPQGTVGPPTPGEGRRRGKSGLGAASLAGALWVGTLAAMDDFLGDHRRQPQVAGYVPASADPTTEAVSVHMVAGSPSDTHVVVRPWLLAEPMHRSTPGHR
jgi:hypothetical protein